MPLRILELIVIALYAISLGFAVVTLVRIRWRARGEARRQRRAEHVRPAFEAYVLNGVELPAAARREKRALIDLGLRYIMIVRGSEADRIVTMLEKSGAVEEALRHLWTGGPWQRAFAAEIVGRLRIKRAVPALIELLDDRHEDVRIVAARALARSGDPRALKPLMRTLADSSRWTLTLVIDNLITMGSPAVPTLIENLEGADHNTKVALIRILGEIRDPAATSALVNIVTTDENVNLRSQAAAALGRLGGPEAEAALLEALDHPQWEVRAQAAKALGRVGNASNTAALEAAIADPEWWVRANCAEALSRLGQEGVEALHRLSTHVDPYVADQARAMLELRAIRRP